MDDDATPTRQQISDAVDPLGWRLIHCSIYTEVLTGTLERAAQAASAAVSAAGADGQGHLIVDVRAGPTIWFQQMDVPRPQRNRIHVDIDVPHDEAQERIAATLGAGGTLLSDAAAPAFWVFADPEGNEACICTWQGRD